MALNLQDLFLPPKAKRLEKTTKSAEPNNDTNIVTQPLKDKPSNTNKEALSFKEVLNGSEPNSNLKVNQSLYTSPINAHF